MMLDTKKPTINYPIDLVYLWCDGNDPAFRARKAAALAKLGKKLSTESIGSERFVDNEELRYSLRSVAKNIPWVHHIFVVTDRQQPRWLNTEHPLVTVVDHREILPERLIPCFNADLIERYLVKIPGLQEHFLYANDDLFIGAALAPEFFFQGDKFFVRVKTDHKFPRFADLDAFQKAYAEAQDQFNKTCLNS